MARILLRAHKHPFEAATPGETYRRNLIGDNVGNLLFSNASYKMLRTKSATIDTDPVRGGAEDAARLNAEYDHVVIPLANAFRLSYVNSLERLAALIEGLRIPVTVLGVGAQLNLDGSPERLAPINRTVRRLVSAVLDKSPSIGVRGEFTESYVRGLGFRDVDVIGCPSLFLNGPRHRVVKRLGALTRSSRISMNLSPYVPGLAAMVNRHAVTYPRLQYVAQHRDALGMLLDPRHRSQRFEAADQSVLPTHRAHPLVAQGRTRMFVDPQPWIDHLRGYDFSFGTRIHGNVAALLAGTPAMVLAHDSRTLELARYYSIPHRSVLQISAQTDAANLYQEADFAAFNSGLQERFERLTDFLDLHGLGHVHQQGEDPHAYDRELASTEFPGEIGGVPVAPGPSAAAQALLARASHHVRRVRRAVPQAA